jgi:DnaK suppressor protein
MRGVGPGGGGQSGPTIKGMLLEKTPMRAKLKIPEDYRPSEDEPFMSERHRIYFRRKLLAWRDEILRSTKETLQHLHDESEQHADIADRASSETERALELRARDRQRKLITKIDAALLRIDDGTYGYCEETGEPISLKRLDARPIATLSVEAQERHEQRERVYRDE